MSSKTSVGGVASAVKKRVRLSPDATPTDRSTARTVEKHPRNLQTKKKTLLSLKAAVQISEVLSRAGQFIRPLGKCIWREAAQVSSGSSDGEEIDRDRFDSIGKHFGGDEQTLKVVRKWDKVFADAWYALESGTYAAWCSTYASESSWHDDDVLLKFKLPSGGTLSTKFLNNQFGAVFDQLWEEAEPSPFGDMTTHETRVDESVRKGRELLAGKHWTVNPTFVDQLVKKVWGLHPANIVRVVPYKLNMYRAGGGFAWHADTPERDLVGTILVGLCEDKGEEAFEIRHCNTWAKWSCIRRDPPVPSWSRRARKPDCVNGLAFYADCPHKVEVKKGVRATLAFKVYAKTTEKTADTTVEKTADTTTTVEKTADTTTTVEKTTYTTTTVEKTTYTTTETSPSSSSSSAASPPVVVPASFRVPEVLKSDLNTLFRYVLGKCGAVGIVLDHAYNLHASTLKGSDAKMYNFLQRVPGVDLQIIPIVVSESFQGGYGECEPPEDVDVMVYPLTDADLAHAVDETQTGVSDQFPHLGDVPFFFHNIAHRGTTGHKISASHVPYASYTGNESQPESAESVYLYRAVLMTPSATFVKPRASSDEDEDDYDDEDEDDDDDDE